MTTTGVRVLLANHWHDDNRGDSAITQGILTLLYENWPDAEVTLTTLAEAGPLWDNCARHLATSFPHVTPLPSPAATELRGRTGTRTRARILFDAAWLWLRTAPSLMSVVAARPVHSWQEIVSKHDVVILVGGSNIFDSHEVPAALSLPRLIAVLGPATTAVRLNKPVLLLGHTIGPLSRPIARRLTRRMLRGVDLAIVREAGSVAVAGQNGARRVEEAPDMAFALKPTPTSRTDEVLERFPSSPDRTLVMSVRQHPTRGANYDDRLIAAFAGAARSLLDSGDVDGVVVLAHTTGPTPIEDDRPISQRLLDEMSGVRVVLVTDDLTPGELSALYGSVSVVVAVRLHAAILALNAGTPTFAVSYLTAKTQGVMTQVGLPDSVAEFRTVTADEISAGVRQLLTDHRLRARLSTHAASRRAELISASRRWFALAGTHLLDVDEPARASR